MRTKQKLNQHIYQLLLMIHKIKRMKKSNLKKVSLGVFMMLFSLPIFAQSTVSGKITDAETGGGLIGANILISGTSIGTTTDLDGNYTLTSDRVLPWTVEVSYTGYTNQEIEITAAGTQDLSLSSGLNINQEIIVSASRKQEKAVDAPASISVLSADKLSLVADGGNVANGLKNTVGVSIVDQGIDRTNVQLRGSAIVNSSRVQVYRDYRPMTQLGTNTWESQLSVVSSIDIKQVEVLRGPAGALYGPGVDAGVIHFLTMDPWDKSGTTLSGTVGEQSLLKFDIRHAGVLSDKFGYKILIGGMGADDFQLDEDLASIVAESADGGGWNGSTAMRGRGVFEGVTLEHGGNMIKEVGNRYGTAVLYFKPTDNISLTGTFDYGQYKGNRRNVQGDYYIKETATNVQLRAEVGDLFMAYSRWNNLGTNDESDLDKQTGYNANYANASIGTNGKITEEKFEIQYPFSIGPLDLAVGGDYLAWTPDGNERRAGRNANTSYQIYGGYLQAKYDITSKLAINAVARFDQFDAFDKGAVSPRVAFIYKPTPSSQIRASYNRSFAAMGPVRTFLDFVGPALPFGAQLQFVGGATGFNFDNSIVAGMPYAQGLNGTSLAGDVIPLEGFFGGGPLAGALNGALGADGVAALQAVAAGQTTGATYTTFRDNNPVSTLAGYGTKPGGLFTNNTIEVGYKGTIGDNLAVQVDIYNIRVENFESNATPITPFIQAPNLASDLGALATSAGLDGAAVTAAVNGTPLGNGGNIGWAESNWSQTRTGGGPQINFGFLNFGEASYWGYDLGLEYYLNPKLSVFGNFSGLSKNEFSLADLGERADSGFPPQFLNTPKSRTRFGIQYLQPSGLFGSIAHSYNGGYTAAVGIFRGEVESRNLVDLTVGYKMDNGLKATLGISNLFKNKYSYFPRLPQITRVATLNLQYHFGGKKE